MLKYFAVLFVLLTVLGCKNKKTSNGNQPEEAQEFYDAYKEIKLPLIISDTSLNTIKDTSTISYPVFTHFISDSIFNVPFGKDRKLAIHPIGRFEQKNKETYFATLVKNKEHAAVYLSVFDKNKFLATMLLVQDRGADGVNTAIVDKRLTIVLNKEWTVKNEQYYKRTILAYNNVGIFTTVLTETNEGRGAEIAIQNPLDTFPKKYKYSGDYAKGTKNFLSVRDGRAPNEYRFFVRFLNENDGETCGGELKGELKMTSEKEGVYTGSGDPCVVNFTFTPTQISVKENGSCGNSRGIKCFFNDTYTKKKEPKIIPKKK